MRKATQRGILLAGAAAFPLLGLWLSAQTLRKTPVTIGHISTKCAALEELRGFGKGNASTQSAQQALDELSVQEAPPLRQIVARFLPDASAEIREEDPEPLQGGWSVRRSDVVCNHVRLETLAKLVAALESERPPWRLRECTITAAGEEPGFGRVTLRLEALHRVTD